MRLDQLITNIFRMFSFILIFVGFAPISGLFGSMKNVTVRGMIKCGVFSADGKKIELWEDDICMCTDV